MSKTQHTTKQTQQRTVLQEPYQVKALYEETLRQYVKALDNEAPQQPNRERLSAWSLVRLLLLVLRVVRLLAHIA